MDKKLIIFVLASLWAIAVNGQSQTFPGAPLNGTGAPTGSCGPGVLYTDNSTGHLYPCENLTWDSLLANSFGNTTFENVQFVDSDFVRGGIDVGDEINKAYANCPANGCEIDVAPTGTAVCYNFSTPIVAATSSKYLLLRGLGASSQTGVGASNGTCLNYTPTTSTTAIRLDYVPSNGDGNARNHGIRNIRLINNQCNTTSGCSSNAVGVSCTSTNAGCQNAVFDTFEVVGFGTGMQLATPATSSQASWGLNIIKAAISYNTTGLTIAGGIELTVLDDVKILGNTTGVSMGSSSDLLMSGGSCDANSTSCIVSTGGDITTVGVHFENQNSNNAQYINAGLSLHIYGGLALDDCASSAACGSVTPGYWFSSNYISVHGQDIFTAGRVPTVVYKHTSGGFIEGITNIAGISVLPRSNVTNVVSSNIVFSEDDGTEPSTIESALFEADGGTAFSCTMVGTLVGWGSGAACSSPQGGNQRFSFVMTTGTSPSANPTLKVTLTTAWPVAPLYQCKIIGGTGTPALVTGDEATISTTVVGPLILNATPSGTYQFACMGI